MVTLSLLTPVPISAASISRLRKSSALLLNHRALFWSERHVAGAAMLQRPCGVPSVSFLVPEAVPVVAQGIDGFAAWWFPRFPIVATLQRIW